MKTLLTTIGWELKLQLRNQIITIAAVVTAVYMIIFHYLPVSGYQKILITLIFSDPAMLGFVFIGVLVLFEKGANTIKAINVTPLKPGIYIWAKAFSLTLISIVAGILMAIMGHGWHLNYFYLLLAIIYASLLAFFIGFIGVFRVKTLNQYLVILPFFLTPLTLPLLNFFELTHIRFFYLIPTQAVLLLFEGTFNGFAGWREFLYAVFYPAPWIVILFWLAKRIFYKYR
ncbi:MAG: ABC transporter permease [Bacteroidia bacterium]